MVEPVAVNEARGFMSMELFPGEGGRAEGTWSELGAGAPTLAAFAALCSKALAAPQPPAEDLSPEAKAILFAARRRGVLEIKGSNEAFEAPARFLAVRVALDDERWLVFRDARDASVTIRFLEGFRQLCAAGLVMHHLYRDFSLTQAGFQLAQRIARDEVQDLLALGSELSRYE